MTLFLTGLFILVAQIHAAFQGRVPSTFKEALFIILGTVSFQRSREDRETNYVYSLRVENVTKTILVKCRE
jgi:hypothetical protein